MNTKQTRREDQKAVMEAAMNNPLIAEKIFNYSSFLDKKNLRLINRIWRDCTLEEWRSNSATIRIQFSDKNDRIEYFATRSNHYTVWKRYTISVATFERMMDGRQSNENFPAPFCIQEKPFRQVILVGGTFSLPPCWGKQLGRSVAHVEEEFKLFKFLDKFGSKLNYLRLENWRISEQSYTEGMKWILHKACPQLNELSLEINKVIKDLSPDPTEIFQRQFPLESQRSKLTKLVIVLHTYWSSNLEIKPDQVLWGLQNLKSLTMSQIHNEYFYPRISFPIGEALCIPLANGGYLNLNEIDFQIEIVNYWRESDHAIISTLSRYIELAQPSFKRFRLELNLDMDSEFDDLFDQFLILNGHLLTHLTLTVKKPFHTDEPRLISHLNGYHFPNLTHLTISFKHNRYPCCYGYICKKVGVLYFDFGALQGMPKLQFLRCFDPLKEKEGEFSLAYQNLPIELSELKEFSFNFGDKLTADSLRMILGWMKGVKKLSLYLDEETFPVVFEMAPQLEQLILCGKDGRLSEAELHFGKLWMNPLERERQKMEWRIFKLDIEMEWRRRTYCGRKTYKQEVRKAKLKFEREKKRMEVEKEEKEWIGEQEEAETWTFVSKRKPRKGDKNVPHFRPRQPRSKRRERKGVDDFTVFCKLEEMKERNVRIFCRGGDVEYKI